MLTSDWNVHSGVKAYCQTVTPQTGGLEKFNSSNIDNALTNTFKQYTYDFSFIPKWKSGIIVTTSDKMSL